MGPAVSFGVAAKCAFPNRPVFSFVGDGAMQMLGLNALVTLAKYWREWADKRFVVAVLNNRDLNMVTWKLRGLGGSPKVTETQDLPDLDYPKYAEWLGLCGLTMRTQEDVGPVWERALREDQPVVIDIKADPNVIALPPHATFEQSKNLLLALSRGDVDRGQVLAQLYKQLAA
jgi:pyruvate dehydrogenase (quinone)